MYHATVVPHRSSVQTNRCVLYLLVRRDGHSEHFDSILLGFISGLLHTSTRLFVPGDGVAIGHHHDVLVLLVVGAPVSPRHRHMIRHISFWHHLAY